jgi:DNA-binding transcriptional LysR family regulator
MIVNNGSFTKAAKNNFVSQPTLSKSVKKLETKLKIELFDRSTRSLILTDAGKLVYSQANKIRRATNELNELLDDLMHTPSGEIKIGIPPLIGTLFFPEIAKHFGKQYPQISLQLFEHGSKLVENLVEDGQIDMGIVVLPVNKNKFNTLPFFKNEFKLFASCKHSLANQQIVKVADLKKENFILFNQEFSLHELVIQQCEQAGFYPNIAYESSQWDLITELIDAQVGVTLFPQAIYSKMNQNSIRTVSLESPPLWELGIITKKDRYLSFAMRSLLQFLKEQFSHV